MMDFPGLENLELLSQWFSAVLAVYAVPAGKALLNKTKDKAAEAVVGAMCEKARGAWTWLKGRFAGDQMGTDILTEMEQAGPEAAASQSHLADHLALKLKRDPDLLKAMTPILTDLAEIQKQLPTSRTTTYAKQIAKNTGDHNIVIQNQGNNVNITRPGSE